MKKFISLSIIFFVVSCAGMQTKREVVDNVFDSSYPKLSIKIDENLQYTDKEMESGSSFFSNLGESSTNIKEEKFFFLNPKDRKGVQIKISKLGRGYWYSDINQGMEDLLEEGYHEYHGKKYRYGVFAVPDTDNTCLLVKRLGKTGGAQSDTLFILFYYKEVKRSLGNYDLWLDPSKLSQKQKEFLTKFSNDFEKDVQFLKK